MAKKRMPNISKRQGHTEWQFIPDDDSSVEETVFIYIIT